MRISGAEARTLLTPHLAGGVSDRRGAWFDRLLIDRLDMPVTMMGFTAPRSFTGEDVLELQMPGHPVLLDRVIEGLLTSGRRRGCDARRAEAGEFTARAFMNGRLSLVQAEGVAATIAARSDAELAAAAWLRNGALGRLASTLADELAATLALVEAGIDFTDEEDVVPVATPVLRERLSAWLEPLDDWLAHAVGAEQLEAIPWVVLTGPPNAGKSTLFNALLGHERAVVSATAGTTRDVLVEPLSITTPHGPAEVMLVDLAGLTGPNDAIDRLMQDAAEQARGRADLHVHCVPVDADADTPVGRHGVPTLEVCTKADLDPSPRRGEAIVVSARREDDLVALRAAIADRLADRAVSLGADAVVLRPRHEAALRSARDELARALSLVPDDGQRRDLPHPELVAAGLRQALDDLASLAGAVTPDDILGRIFAKFCIGK